MTAFAASVGAQITLGYALELLASPGTPVTPTDYIPVEPDNTTLNFDPKRQPLELALGTLVVDQYLVELDATVSGDVKFPLFQELGWKAILASGFTDVITGAGAPYTHTATLTTPRPVTLTLNQGNQALQHAGMYARSCKIEANSKAAVMATLTYDGMGRPALVSLAVPSIASDVPYVWSHVQNSTIIVAGSAVADIDNLELMWEFDNQLFYGTKGDNTPQQIVPGPLKVSGKFTKLFDNYADYSSFATKGETAGDIKFVLNQSSGFNVAFDMTASFYAKHDFKRPLRGPITEDFEFVALGPAGVSPLTMTLLNSHATTYTPNT